MIVEGLVTTLDQQGMLNVAPMGPVIHGDFSRLTLRPFQGSTTCNNLTASDYGVFHVVDRTDVIARAAVSRLTELPETEDARQVSGRVLIDCCRWFEFRIVHRDLTDMRTVMEAEVVHCQERRPFFGFNRARNAIIEAAILATRLHLTGRDSVMTAFEQLESAVEKTGGAEELESFAMLKQYVKDYAETGSVQGEAK